MDTLPLFISWGTGAVEKARVGNLHALARSVAHARMWVAEHRRDQSAYGKEGELALQRRSRLDSKKDGDALDDLAEFLLHDLARALRDRGNGHKASMSEAPIVRCEHSGDKRERRWKDGCATQGTGDTIERVLVRVRICVIRWILRRLARGKHSSPVRDEGHTYVGFEPGFRVVFGYFAHALQTSAYDDVHPPLHAFEHIRLGFAEGRHELERALPHLVLLSGLSVFPVFALS